MQTVIVENCHSIAEKKFKCSPMDVSLNNLICVFMNKGYKLGKWDGGHIRRKQSGKRGYTLFESTFSTVYCHRVLNERLQTLFDMWSGVNISGFLPSTVSK